MEEAELNSLLDIIKAPGWESHRRLKEYVKTVKVTVDAPAPRTSAQGRAIHLWFRQIAEICQNQGVTFDLIIKHTHHVAVTEYAVKALWHVLQKALYGTESTRDLTKSGQIDRMVDHFVVLFAKEEVELPPFPNRIGIDVT